jgi:hypothetical protein
MAENGVRVRWRATGKSFVKKISGVAETGNEEDVELVLSDVIPDPVKAHVQRLWHLIVDVIGKAYGDLVVTKNRVRRLRVAYVFEDLTLVRRDSSGGEDSGVLDFGDECTYNGDACAVR